MVMMIVMQMKASRADKTRGCLLIGGVAKTHVTFAKARSLGTIRQGGWWLRRWCLRLLLLLLMRMMRVLVLRVLCVLDRRRCYRFMHGNPATFLVQGAAMEVTLADRTTVRTIHWTAIPRDRLVNVIRALGCMDVDGRAVERIRALFHQTTWHGVRLRRLLPFREKERERDEFLA